MDTDTDYELEQLGLVAPCMIQEISDMDDNGIPIFFRKLDIKDSFLQLVCEIVQEYNIL